MPNPVTVIVSIAVAIAVVVVLLMVLYWYVYSAYGTYKYNGEVLRVKISGINEYKLTSDRAGYYGKCEVLELESGKEIMLQGGSVIIQYFKDDKQIEVSEYGLVGAIGTLPSLTSVKKFAK